MQVVDQDDAVTTVPPQEALTKCVRCGRVVPVDEDGFCAACAQAVEQACL